MLALALAAFAVPAGAASGGNSDNAKLCQKGGWQQVYRSDGSTFANQRECVSYGAKGGSIIAITNEWQAACVQNGGTFSVQYFPPLVPVEYVCQPVSSEVEPVLTPICLSYPDSLGAGYFAAPQLAFCERRLLGL